MASIRDGTKIWPPVGQDSEPSDWKEFEKGKVYRAIGWLGRKLQPTGDVPDGFLESLLGLVWSKRAHPMRGYHFCQFCELSEDDLHWRPATVALPDGTLFNLGSAEIWVPADDSTVFCAPNLIIHYVKEHRYCPPKQFIDAVMRAAKGTIE
ncbi:MAG: hypothetical protein KDB82_10330 [Planctomycetes bacterium]|nr:hypothetical protein [Planctomycetota bacterium]